MLIKSAQSFRKYIWESPKGGNKEKSIDYNFVGSFAEEKNETIHGFFKMYHGIKEDIASYLPSILKIAEDGQAIYEFLQNAVDCNSTHFYIFYNEKNFLAINNGEPFDIDGLQSVLNIAQTTKKSCDKIGRFGIGFKLVHRLVGKNEGVEELVNEYKGPIMFSWSKLKDLYELLEEQPIEPILPNFQNNKEYNKYLDAPYLLKLILTNFPSEPKETVKDLNYKNRVVFKQEELHELVGFLNESFEQHIENIDFSDLEKGTIFFLRLGEGKKDLLDRDYEDLKQGVQYSMNTLKKLKKVYLNNELIEKQSLDLEEFEILKNSPEFDLINPEYKDCNIKVSFGYYRDYKKSIKIKASPNFYKYFPMGDETNGFSFIIHCDSFSNEANRRKLQKDSTNKNLLPVISDFIIARLNEYKVNNREQFLRLYACLLLSDIPNKQNNEWLKPIFYDQLLDCLCSNIPTKNNQFSEEPENVKINKLKINLNLADFGLDHIQWFEWKSDNDFDLTLEAIDSNKLGLESWDIRDIVENADIDCINEWIENQNQEQHTLFLNELEKSDLRKATKNRLCEIKLFKFSDDCFYSANDFKTTDDLIFNFTKTIEIKSELEKLGFITSEIDISEYENIFSALSAKLPSDKSLYENIAKKCEYNELCPKEKQKLFLNFVQEETKFDNIGEGTLRNLALFCDNQNKVKPLCELVNSSLPTTPIWINPFKIKEEEHFDGLKKYLISEQELYQEIILQNWDYIISEVKDVEEFYKKVKFYYDQDEKNTPLKKQAFIFINDDERFVTANNIFYSDKFAQISNYQDFQQAVFQLSLTLTPQKEILNFFKTAPFEVKNHNLLEIIRSSKVELKFDEAKTILAFCKSNNENFFQKCTIEKTGQNYLVELKSKDIFQVFPNKESRFFIENYLSNTFKILPYEFDEFKEENGVLYREPFYNQLIHSVDVDDFKTELIDIIAYDEPKRNFLLELSEVRFSAGEQYNKESFEYKVLNLACDSKILRETDYPKFREKIIIETGEQDLTLAEIPPFADKIKIEGYELSLAKILPNTYQNSNFLSSLMNIFIELGVSKEKLNHLFNISQEPEPESIFALLSEGDSLLQNEQQLAFLLLYNKLTKVSIQQFRVSTLDGKSWELQYTYYINSFDFIGRDYLLEKQYSGLENIINLPFNCEEYAIIASPYFSNNAFICQNIKSDLTKNEKLSLLNFIYQKWLQDENKSVIKRIDWSKISDTETDSVLGFNPIYAVYPTKYAVKSEELPKYLQEWLSEDSNKINFFADLGVFTESSNLVCLRKFFIDESPFSKVKLTSDKRLSDEVVLFNTLEWIRESLIELSSIEQFEVLEEMIRVINLNRVNRGGLKFEKEFDFQLLERDAKEWEITYYKNWKEQLDDKYAIYLYNGPLPIIAKLNEIEDYVFYRYSQGNIAIDENNCIYISSDSDIKKALSSLISDDNNEFSTEDLLLLYQTKENNFTNNEEVTELKNEIERLKKEIESLTQVSRTDTVNVTTLIDEYLTEIKEKSENYLFRTLVELYPNKKVKWLNFNETTDSFEESWQNHDFEILDTDGKVLHYIDCKGTPKTKKTFYLTSSEWAFFLNCVEGGRSYQIYRIFNVEGIPHYLHIDNLWQWIKERKVVPYLSATETIKGGRVFLTLT